MLVLKLLIIFLKAVSTDDLVKMARFVLEKNYFEFNCDVKKNTFQEQRLVQCFHGLMRVYLWMSLKPGTILQSQSLQPLVWFTALQIIFKISRSG